MNDFRDLTVKHRRLAEIVEMIHTASLIHDDVLDESDLRRGKLVFRNARLIFLTSLYFLAMCILHTLKLFFSCFTVVFILILDNHVMIYLIKNFLYSSHIWLETLV